MAALVGVDRFNVAQRLHRLVLKLDSVSTHRFSSQLTDLPAVARALSLRHGNATDTDRVALSQRLLIHASDVKTKQNALGGQSRSSD